MFRRLRNRVVVGVAFLAMSSGVGASGGGVCPWDVDGTGDVGTTDLLVLLAAWGTGGPGDFTGDGVVGTADLLELLAHWGPCPPAPSFFGHYAGSAFVTDLPFHPPGSYPAEVAIAQTASGVVGYVNIVFDPTDFLGGIITHAFSGLPGPAGEIELQYSDRICGAGDPIGLCYPHFSKGFVQYSFVGLASVEGGQLVLSEPSFLPDLPYAATLPFESATLTRTPGPSRDTFDGFYPNLEYIWMGTALFPLPLPLFGNNEVEIVDGEIVEWINNGFDVPLAGEPSPVIVDWCFDDSRGRGWMNQQGLWDYDWVLDPGGEGVSVIVTFADVAPDCRSLEDVLQDDGLDLVHQNLAGIMFELP